MKIVIAGSMQFADQMMEWKHQLEQLGHQAEVSMETAKMAGKTDEEKEAIKLELKFNQDAIKHFWQRMDGADALLVLNYDKRGIKNYIGGNTLMDMAMAYFWEQKIFLLNPIPEMLYSSEIIAMKPTVINGDDKLIE